MKTMTLNLSDEEMEAVEKMAADGDMSKTAVVKQALRIYQLIKVRMHAGETMSFSGDPQRAIQFIGPGF